jgi:hypothetical protein
VKMRPNKLRRNNLFYGMVRAVSRQINTPARFEFFAEVTMKNGVFRDVTPCGSCKNLRFRGTSRLYHQGVKNR